MSLQPVTVPMTVEAPQRIRLGVQAPEGVELDNQVRIVHGSSGDYEQLDNKPQINGVELIGNKTPAELGISQTCIHRQTAAAAVWTIHHDLGKYPSITVVDSGGSVVVGDVDYIDENSITVTFTGAFSGIAYLN